jgi:hypothetical protein
MNRSIFLVVAILIANIGALFAQDSYNHVRSYTPILEVEDADSLVQLDGAAVQSLTHYYDGLGRPVQVVTRQGSPAGLDVVQYLEYDSYGRERFGYLPYVSDTAVSGFFKSGAKQEQETFYEDPPSFIPADDHPWAETGFEASPLSRVIRSGAPGTDWQLSGGHAVGIEYKLNKDGEVFNWLLDSLGELKTNSRPYYRSGELTRIITTDEHGHIVVEYKDKQQRVVLKKVQAEANPAEYSHTGWASTYYIYDQYSNLRYVIPPQAVEHILEGNITAFESQGGILLTSDTTLATGSNTGNYYYLPWVEVTLPGGLTAGAGFRLFQFNLDLEDGFLARWAFYYSYDARQRMIE